MKMHWLLSSLAFLFVVPNFGLAQEHNGPGALLGGVAGALAGAAIGKNNHNTAAGALIGGAAGVVTGAAVGSVMDEKERARAYQYQQQQYQQQQAIQMAHAVSIPDVLAMTRSGVSDDVIINQIRRNGMERKVDTSDVITLHKEHVSNAVITAMQQSAGPVAVSAVQPVQPVPVYAQPVVVEGYPYAPPPPYYRYYYGPSYYRPYPPPPPAVHWGVSVYGR